MKVICAWCGDLISHDPDPGDFLSHGICSSCAASHFNFNPVNVEIVLDQFSYPILVVGPDGHVETANRSALNILKKERKDVRNKLGGNVFNCVHSYEPGGCGKTVHCLTCTIRQTVEEVMRTGTSVYKVPATLKVLDEVEEHDIHYRISAEKAGGFVILTVEDSKTGVQPPDQGF